MLSDGCQHLCGKQGGQRDHNKISLWAERSEIAHLVYAALGKRSMELLGIAVAG
jgi:hypothetical protein